MSVPDKKKRFDASELGPTIRRANPDADLLRAKARARGKEADFNKVGCPHPVVAMQQYMDVPTLNAHAKAEVPLNVFLCMVCKEVLWLVDGSGRAAEDGT